MGPAPAIGPRVRATILALLLAGARPALAMVGSAGQTCDAAVVDPLHPRFVDIFHNCSGPGSTHATYNPGGGDSVVLCLGFGYEEQSVDCIDNDSSGHNNIFHIERDTAGWGVGEKLYCASALQIAAGSNWDSISCYHQQTHDPNPSLGRTGLAFLLTGVTTREPGDRYQQSKGTSTGVVVNDNVPLRRDTADVLVFAIVSQTNGANGFNLSLPWGATVGAASALSTGNHRIDMAVYVPSDPTDNPLGAATGTFDSNAGNWIAVVMPFSAGPAPPPSATPAPQSPTPTPLAPLAAGCSVVGYPKAGQPRPTAARLGPTVYDVNPGDSIIMGCTSNSAGAFGTGHEIVSCFDDFGNNYGIAADLSQLPPSAYNRATLCASLHVTTFVPSGNYLTMTFGPTGNACCVATLYPQSLYNFASTTGPLPAGTPQETPGYRNGQPAQAGATGQDATEDTGDFPSASVPGMLIVSGLSVIAPTPILSKPWNIKPMIEVGNAGVDVLNTDATLNRQWHQGQWIATTITTDGGHWRRTDGTTGQADVFGRRNVAIAAQFPLASTPTFSVTPTPTPTSLPTATPSRTNTINPAAPTNTRTGTPTTTPTVTPTPSPTQTLTPRPLAYVGPVGAGTSADPWPTGIPQPPNAVAIHVTTSVTGGDRHTIFVGYVTTDSDCFPFSATDTQGNTYTVDDSPSDSGIRTATIRGADVQHSLTTADYIVVKSCVGPNGTCSTNGCGATTTAARAAAAIQMDGVGPLQMCLSAGNNGSHPSTSTSYPPGTPGVTAKRVMIAAVGTKASESVVGFCQARGTPSTPGPTPTGTPGIGPQVCVNGIGTPQYAYPTPTPNAGVPALPRAGTTTFPTNRLVNVELIQQSTGASIGIDGYLFQPGTLTPLSKNWLLSSCLYRGAAQ